MPPSVFCVVSPVTASGEILRDDIFISDYLQINHVQNLYCNYLFCQIVFSFHRYSWHKNCQHFKTFGHEEPWRP